MGSVLDSLVALDLSEPNVEEKILAACRIRLAEPEFVDCVHLFFGGDEEVIVEKMETVVSLKAKLDRIRKGAGASRGLGD